MNGKDLETTNSSSSSASSTIDVSKIIRFITWNIDGLDKSNIVSRTEAVLDIIEHEKAIIVFLQEVIPTSEKFLRKRLPKYEFFSGNTKIINYYTLTLIHKDYVKLENNEIIKFEESRMGRNLLKTRVKVDNTSITLFNTHLESMKQYSNGRVAQLSRALKLVSEIPETDTVIFAGDLNLIDNELTEMDGLPINVIDVWEKTGHKEMVEFTWDLTQNDNKQLEGPKYKQPKFRFDRVYIRESTPAKLDASKFGLIGLQRLEPELCFPSDHWGIRVDFKFV